MTTIQWILLAAGAIAIATYVAWWYRTREEPVAGRGWAMTLRASALTLLLLILINPVWPRIVSRPPQSTILVDASLSMTRPLAADGVTAWDVARDSLPGGSELWLFGSDEPAYVSFDSLPERPEALDSRLLPGVHAVALSGAERAVVWTDRGLSDATVAAAEARRLGLMLSFRGLAPTYPSYGLARIRAPAWAQVGDSVEVEVEVVAARAQVDSLRLEVVDEGGSVQASTGTLVPASGRFSTVRLGFVVDAPPGERRYEVRIADPAGDLEDRDDSRAFYLAVGEEARGPLLISLRPDWEPSFLVPNLDRLSDAPATAYYWVEDSLVSLDSGLRRVGVETLVPRARLAPLLVLHGYGADAPSWARALAAEANRLLIFPAGRTPFGLETAGVRIQAPSSGDWYVTEELPRSPVVLDLVGFVAEALPPLSSIRPVLAEGSWSPLSVKRLRRGEAVPAVVAGSGGGRRWAVASGEGYWRWASRAGAGRRLYRALWTAVGGWLLEGSGAGRPAAGPETSVVGRGEPLRWHAPAAVDSLLLEVLAGDSAVFQGRARGGDSVAARLPPGRYRYSARVYQGERAVASSAGAVEVEAFNPELLPREPAEVTGTDVEGPGRPERTEHGERRLATLGWPYLLLMALLVGEWAVRRRIGLL